MAEELVLPASVTDKFSKPLLDLQKKLRDFRPSEGLRAVERNFRTLKTQVEQATRAIKDAGSGLASGMGLPGLSIGALGAAGAIAALAANTRQFATQTVAMRNFARDTGIATTKLKELQAVSTGLDLDPDAMKGAVEFAARNTDYLRNKKGTYQELQALGPGGRSIAADLAGTKTNDEALEKILGYLQNQKDPAQRRTLGRLLLGNEDAGVALGNADRADFANRRSAARASIAKQNGDDEKKARDFLDATERVSAALDKIKLSVGGALAPNLTAVADAMAAFANNHSGDAKEFFDGVSATLSSHNWNEDAIAIALVFEKTKAFIDYMVGLSPKMEQFKKDRGSAADGENYSLFGNTLGARKGSAFDWLLQHAPQWDKLDGKPFIGVTPKPAAPGLTRPDTAARDDYSPIAYRPGARGVFTGMASVQNTVATIAAGVTRGMQDFAQSLQAGGAESGPGGSNSGGGFMKASLSSTSMGALNGIRAVRTSLGVGTSAEPLSGAQLKGTSSEMVEYIKQAAIARGIDPNVALRVARSEGGLINPYQRATGRAPRGQAPGLGSTENSYGPFQLWISGRGKGLGDRAMAAGIDPRKDWKKGIDFALDEVHRKGWGQWYGAKAAGITGMRGVGPLPPRPPIAAEPRESLHKKKAAADAAAGKDGLHGRVSIDVTSKDAKVNAKHDGSPLFQELTIKRGNLTSI